MGINAKKDEDEAQVDELVEMIDKLIGEGGGHLTIDVDEMVQGVKVKTYRSNDCGKKGACCQPNEKVDDDDNF
ncbi:MAG: hypothetical protein ACI4I6_06295 [Hominimerdicola sp.]